MPEEGEVAIPLNNDIAPKGTTISQVENELGGEDVSGKIAEFTKNVDALRFGITSKNGDEKTMADATSYVESHIDGMLNLCLGDGELSNQALRNVYLALLCAHLSDNEPLRTGVEEYFSNEDRLEALVVNQPHDKSLPVFASLYNWAKDFRKDEFEEVLSRNIGVFDGFIEKGDLRFALTFLETLATRKFSKHSEKFKAYLKGNMDTIAKYISEEDISQSEQILGLAQRIYASEEGVSPEYSELLSSNIEVLLKGFHDGKFINELQTLLREKGGDEPKGRIVTSLVEEFEGGGIEKKREVYEMLTASLLSDQPEGVSHLMVDFLNKNISSIASDIFDQGGKIYYLDTILRECSDEAIEEVFMQLDQKLEKTKDAASGAYLFNVINGSIGQRSGSIRRALPLYEKHMQKLQDVMFDPFLTEQLRGWKIDVYKKAVSNAALYGSGNVSDQAIEMVCHSLQFDPKAFFGQYGLDYTVLVDAWRLGLGDVFENFSHNKKAVERLVGERGVDIIKILSEEFGIKNFSRYPFELLVKQYDEREVKDKKFGVMVFSTFDHGKAFNSEEDRQVMMSMKEQMGDNILMRFAEAGSRFELVKRLSQLHQIYGQMSFGLVGAHGADNRFQLGLGGERKELSTDDLLGTGAEKAGRFFEDGATLILESCSTGADAGIAEQISKSLGMKVIAPKEDSGGIQEIKMTVNENTPPDFDVNFWYTKGREYQMGSLVNENSAIEDEA